MQRILLLLVILCGLTGCSQEAIEPVQHHATQPEYWTAQGYEITSIMSSAGEVIFVSMCKPLDDSHHGYDACVIIDYEDQDINACIGSGSSCYDPATDMSSEYNDFFGSVITPWPSHVEYNSDTKEFSYTFIEA